MISGVVFSDIATTAMPLGFILVPFVVGLLIHKMTGFMFALILAKGYTVAGITALKSRVMLGGVYGLGIFAMSWYVALPLINPALLLLNPYVFAATHVMFGMMLGKLTKPRPQFAG